MASNEIVDSIQIRIKIMASNQIVDPIKRKCSLNVPTLIRKPVILGSSHGLLCLYGFYPEENLRYLDPGLRVVVLWNPSIQKSVVIKVPNEFDYPYRTVVGFGVCPNTNDPKLVKINYIGFWIKGETTSCIPLHVEVFTLSSRAWRLPFRNLPRNLVGFSGSHIVTNGFIYWLAFDWTKAEDFQGYNLIISFHLTSEEFSEIYLPEPLEQPSLKIWSISKLRDSLVALEIDAIGIKPVYCVWMMEHGVPNSFRKLFTIDVPNVAFHSLLGFRENGELLLKTINSDKDSAAVKVYEPSTKHIKDLVIYGDVYSSFFISSYNMETLILLDQPDSSILF